MQTELSGHLSNEERAILHDVGFDSETSRAGTSVLIDHGLRLIHTTDPNVEILPLAEALRTYDFVQDLMFGLVEPDANHDVALVAEHMRDPLGHFVWVKPGAKVELPVQTFTLMETPQARQFTHDITLIDEGAEVEMISGSAVPGSVHKGRHVSINETYLRRNAHCKSVSIEQWGAAMQTYSYGYSDLGEGAHDASTSVMMSPVALSESHSRTTLGADADVSNQAIIFAAEGTTRVLKTQIELNGAGARCEDIARMVSSGGTIVNDALLTGNASETNGFLGCDGLKLTDQGEIRAVPALVAHAEGSMLSHEASVGMIDNDKLNYLMASGPEEDTARSLIVQGFLALEDKHIPSSLRQSVTEMIAKAKSGGM
ncbi:MAG: SufD family Fe-S cluster assembly protein [Pseudomonadota bacterium]